MKKVQNPRAKAILILTFCLLFCSVPKGRATDEIQLRKYPAPDGPVLDTVLKKTDFKIIESFGPWRYVVIEGSTYGGGWINSEDLKNEPAEKSVSKEGSKAKEMQTETASKPAKRAETVKKPSLETESPLKRETSSKTVSKINISAGKVKIKPISIRVAEKPVKSKEDPNKTLEPEKFPKTVSKKDSDNEIPKILEPQKEAPEKKQAHLPQLSENALTAAPPEEKPKSRRNVRKLENNEAPPVEKASANSPENVAIPPEKDVHLWNGNVILPATAEASENAVNPAIAQQSGQSPSEKVEPPPGQTAIKEILHIGLRLLTVIMSCLAIIFSYKAKKMADMSYALTLQLQQTMKINLGREFDDRY